MDSIIQVKNTKFSYEGNSWVFQDLNFKINRGEIIGIIGGSGSGKTTLCYLLKGVIPHTIRGKIEGSIVVDNQNVRKTKLVSLAKSVGMVFQDLNAQLFANTVREEILFGLRNFKMDLNNAEKAISALQLQEIADKPPMNLSMGQKQRVILASIIAMQPKILILDEPSVHLDTINKLALKNWLIKLHRKRNLTIIIASNDPWLIGNMCTSILQIENGSVIRKSKSDVMELGTTWTWKS
jgi:energy-coupling factor transporter ATP-binding protein EcfA2